MSWITIVWSINVGACLTLATMYLAVWCGERKSFVRLLFSCIAASAALIAAYELQLFRADTPEEYGAILRWRPLSTWVLVLSLVAFTRLCLHAESLLPGNYRCSAAPMGWRDGFDSARYSESLELTQSGNFAAAPCLFR